LFLACDGLVVRATQGRTIGDVVVSMVHSKARGGDARRKTKTSARDEDNGGQVTVEVGDKAR